MQKSTLFLLSCYTLLSFTQGLAQDEYLDEKRFIGTWVLMELNETGGQTYTRADPLSSSVPCVQFKADGTCLRRSFSAGIPIDTEAEWFSMSLGNASIYYDDSAQMVTVYERCEMSEEGSTFEINTIDTDLLEGNSEFVGSWQLIESFSDDGPQLERVDYLADNMIGFVLEANGNGIIQTWDQKHKKILKLSGVWWLNDEGDYFDIQYFNPSNKFIVIEGYSMQADSPKLLKTRYDLLSE